MPADFLVCSHKSNISPAKIRSTSNSPITLLIGAEAYTTIFFTSCLLKIDLLNSYFFSPQNILSANSGLIDNNTFIRLCLLHYCSQMVNTNSRKSSWGRINVGDNPQINPIV